MNVLPMFVGAHVHRMLLGKRYRSCGPGPNGEVGKILEGIDMFVRHQMMAMN